jgi:hypothetical protein
MQNRRLVGKDRVADPDRKPSKMTDLGERLSDFHVSGFRQELLKWKPLELVQKTTNVD